MKEKRTSVGVGGGGWTDEGGEGRVQERRKDSCRYVSNLIGR